MEQKPSEIIEAFLALVAQSHTEYNNSKGKVDYFNKHTYELVHKLEDCPDKTLFYFARQWRQETQDRRKERDNMALWETIHEFGRSAKNKPFLRRLKGLVTEQKRTEGYLETPPEQREFKGGAD